MAISFSPARVIFAVTVFAACIAFARAVGNEDFFVPLALALPAAGLALVAKFHDVPLIVRTYFVTACGILLVPLLLMPVSRPPGSNMDGITFPIAGAVIGWWVATFLNHRDRVRNIPPASPSPYKKSLADEADDELGEK
jgi:glycopeptide antibiotics resistance protein